MVYLFFLQARANGWRERQPQGALRTLLVFLKQPDEEQANYALCESVLEKSGWDAPSFRGAMPATPEAVRGIQRTPEPAIDRAYREAAAEGFSVLAFAD